MKSAITKIIFSFLILLVTIISKSQADTITFKQKGLVEPVRVIIDKWGISHIYANNEEDLFFTQGYCAARERLFQFEIWRRQATGTVAEILGPDEIKRDIGTRLFLFRGDISKEMNHYHPNGDKIITSYVRGVNAWIEETKLDPSLLPLEFLLLDIKPGKWTPEVVISRHQGLLGNIGSELNYGRAVALLGPEKVKQLSWFQPGEPDISLDTAINGSFLFDNILELYNSFRTPIRFQAEDLVSLNRKDDTKLALLNKNKLSISSEFQSYNPEDIGSNNWVISGQLTESGYPFMANDPHRSLAIPSLRYWTHLVAPGWNVIGGGEPEIPGISIGHNEYGTWGLTVFQTDGEDLYVYNTNPDNLLEYKYQDRWEDMKVLNETIKVKGQEAVSVELKYTRHGPVVYEDTINFKAYAVRAAWMEIGGSPYLASLRMNQSQTWEEFRDACSYSFIPGENMIWADINGNIGWQAVGIAPVRPNWSGLVPVPGDGRYEWDGYLPIKEKPNTYNPSKGYIQTANNNLVPENYPHRNAVGWVWSDPFRSDRIAEVLGSSEKHTMADMKQLQTDYYSFPASKLVPLLSNLNLNDERVEKARRILLDWDYILDKNSVPAGIYVYWERNLQSGIVDLVVPAEARRVIRNISMKKMIGWLISPEKVFKNNPAARLDSFLIENLTDAVEELIEKLGENINDWKYGNYKHVKIRHPLSKLVNPELQDKLDVGPVPRGGNSYTVGNTAGGNNQTHGATFRIITDVGNWDNSVGMNSPGQSGDPDSPFYNNLFEIWANDEFFPVLYSKEKIESSSASEVLILLPKK